MLRFALRSEPRIRLPTSSCLCRRFHSTPIVRNEASVNFLSGLGAHLPAFHNLFQYVHEYTSLPWLLSIPLATVLVRSLVTPVRYYYALRHRDHRRAEPELRIARALVDKQAKMRSDAGIASVKLEGDNDAWTETQWETRRAEIEKRYPRATNHRLWTTTSNRDVTAIGAHILVAINTSTILSQAYSNPALLQLSSVEAMKVPLLVCFALLAIANSNYYSDNVLGRLNKTEEDMSRRFTSFNPLKWMPLESEFLLVVLLPLCAAFQLAAYPMVVALSCFSNSAYTWLERISINSWLKMPVVSNVFETKGAVQSNKRKRWNSR